METAALDYTLPEELIAQHPCARRDGSRLLVLDRAAGTMRGDVFSNLPEYLRAGDCLALNDTRVIRARLHGHKETGGRVEIFLLHEDAPGEWTALLRPSAKVKPGTEVLLPTGIRATAGELRAEYPSLELHPVVQDIADPLQFADDLRRPVLFALIGSTIGNFEQDAAVDMLANVRRAMSTEDRFLLGADLRPGRGKSRERLTAAYNDSAGVTAEFNLNILTVINRGIGTDFDPDCFSHRAFYDADQGRIEMHLVSCSEQEVHFPGGDVVRIGEGETIRTEISCKYDLRSIEALFGAAGMSMDRLFQDQEGLYALAVGRVEP